MIRSAAKGTRVKILLKGIYIQQTGTYQFSYNSNENHLGEVDGRLDNGVYMIKLDAPNTGVMLLHAQYLERVEDEVEEAEHANQPA